MEKDKVQKMEEAVKAIFRTSVSGSGEEELLRIASTYSQQVSARQMKVMLYLGLRALTMDEAEKEKVKYFIDRWFEMKKYNNSAPLLS